VAGQGRDSCRPGFSDLEVGQTVTLKATVKSHDTYQDRRETLLARPKLVRVEG
jgi:hypothetical protein